MYAIIQKIIEGLISSTLKNILTPEDAKKEKEDQKSEWKQKVNEMNELLEKCSTVLDGIKEKDKKENEVMKKLEEKIAALKRTASHENYCTSESPNVNNEEMNNLLKGLDELTTYVSKIPQPGKDNLSKDQPLPTSNFKGQPLPPGAYGGQSPSCSYTSGYPQTGSVPPFFPNLALPPSQHYSSQYVCQPQPVWQPYPVANVNPAPAPIYRSGTKNDRGGYKKNDLSRPQGQFQSFNNQQSQQYASRDRKPFNKTGDDVSKESDQQSTNNEAPILSKTNDPRSSFYKQNNNGNKGNFNNNQNFESHNRRDNMKPNWKGSPANNSAPIRPPPMGTQRPDNVEQNSGQKGSGFNNQNLQSNNTYGRDNMKPNWKGSPANNSAQIRPPPMGTQRPDNVEQNSGQKGSGFNNQNLQSNNTYGRDNMKPNWKGSPANNSAPIRPPPMGTQRPDNVEQNSGQKGSGFNNQNLQSNNTYGRDNMKPNWKGSPANNSAQIRPPPMGTQRPDNVEQNSGQKGSGFNNQNLQSNNTYGRDNMKPNWKGSPANNSAQIRPPPMGTQRPDNVEQNSGQKGSGFNNQNLQSNNTYGRDNMKPNWKGSPANNSAPTSSYMGTQRSDNEEQNSGQKGCGFNQQNSQSNNTYGRKTNNRYKPRQTTDFKKSDGKGNRDTEVSDPDILTHFLGMNIITKDEAICKGIDLNLGVSCLKILNGEDMYIPTTLLDIIDYKEAHSKAYVLFG